MTVDELHKKLEATSERWLIADLGNGPVAIAVGSISPRRYVAVVADTSPARGLPPYKRIGS
jgi:hypothetical protein